MSIRFRAPGWILCGTLLGSLAVLVGAQQPGARTREKDMGHESFHGIWKHGPRRFAVLAAVLMGSVWLGATPASATTLTVCHTGCAYTQIASAVAAASSGDTVSVAAGTYHGGFTIDQNLSLVGAGAKRTIIRGGGPVITVGRLGGSTRGPHGHDSRRDHHGRRDAVKSHSEVIDSVPAPC